MMCFAAKLVTWHDFGTLQNLPSKGLCLGQMEMGVSCVTDTPRVPALAGHDKLGFSDIATFR